MKYQFEYHEINNCISCPMCFLKDYHKGVLKCKAETPYRFIKRTVRQKPPKWCRLKEVVRVEGRH